MSEKEFEEFVEINEKITTVKYSGKRPVKPLEEVINSTGELTEYGKWYYERPTWKTKTIHDVWESAKVEEKNKVIDRVSGKEITWEKVKPRGEQWHMGHKYGYEFSKLQKSAAKREISIKQFREEYNTSVHIEPELPSSNLGHKGEAPKNIYFGH